MLLEIKNNIKKDQVAIFPFERLSELLSKCKTIEEQDTYFSDMIRILGIEDEIYIQEKTNKNEISLRKSASLDEAKAFIKKRLETYENMWNGCGCKVNYYS